MAARARQRAARDAAGTAEAARSAAAAGPWFMLGIGVVCGGVGMIHSAPIGGAVLAVCTAAAVVLLAGADRVRRLSRWTTGAAAAGMAALCAGPFAAGAAIAAALFDPPTLLGAALALGALTAAWWRRAVRRREAEWEARRAVNEGEVLDLQAGTFDVGRNFVYEAGAGRTKADAALGRAVPAVAFGATLAAGLGRRGGADVRELVVAALAPVILLGLLPAVAAGVVTWRKIRAYERQLGRDIVNR